MDNTLESHVEQRETASVREVSQLLYHSYELSQGSFTLQKRIIEFVGLTSPNTVLSDDNENLVRDRLMSMIEGRLGILNELNFGDDPNHIAVGRESVVAEVDRLFTVAKNLLGPRSVVRLPPEDTKIEKMITEILESVIALDFHYVNGAGRTRNLHSPDNSKRDMWKSHLRYYFIEGHRTPSQELNILLDNMQTQWNSRFRDPLVIAQRIESMGVLSTISESHVLEIAETWKLKHPGQQFFISD